MRLPDSFTLRRKPRGLLKWLLRAPVWFYSLGLGFLLGERFLLLVHRGRKSRTIHRTVVEVVARTVGEYIVCSGTGPGADWYRNLQEEPALAVGVGSRRWTASQRFLTDAEAAQVFADYERRNPRLAERLLGFMGNSYDGTDAGRLEMMKEMPMVAFSAYVPLTGGQGDQGRPTW